MRIGIDLMGSDSAPHVLFTGVLQAAERLSSSYQLIVIATPKIIEKLAPDHPSIRFIEAEQEIRMEDDPSEAVRHKKDSSLVKGILMLQNQELDAFVSCGNTGALVTSAALMLPMKEGIKRPALLVNLPTEKGMMSVVDVGGAISAKAQNLVQNAFLGISFQRDVLKKDNPKVALLNIGEESIKGTVEVRQAYEMLSQADINFVGNIEARNLFKGEVDVLVTDGFTGNVLLKATEGVAAFIFTSLGANLNEDSHSLRKQFSYDEYPGAIVAGVQGLIIKSHGEGSPKALFNSILGAAQFLA